MKADVGSCEPMSGLGRKNRVPPSSVTPPKRNDKRKSRMKTVNFLNVLRTCSLLLIAAPWTALDQTTFTKTTTGDIVNDGGNSFAAAWGDYDGDGFLDLLVTNTGTPTTDSSKNYLYHNEQR